MTKARLYGLLLTSFFWLVQFNDLLRVKWWFDELMNDGALASWMMTFVVELGMGLFSMFLLNRITANNQRTWKTNSKGKRYQAGYRRPTLLLWFSVLTLGATETFISVAYFYEFGQVTKLTERLLGGDTLWTALAFGMLSTVVTFVFSAVEGERTRIATMREGKQAERKAAAIARKENARQAQAEARQAQLDATKAQVASNQEATEAQAEASKAQLARNLLASGGNLGATLRQYTESPGQSQVSVAQALGISRQAVGQHLRKLEQEGLIKRNGAGVEVQYEASTD